LAEGIRGVATGGNGESLPKLAGKGGRRGASDMLMRLHSNCQEMGDWSQKCQEMEKVGPGPTERTEGEDRRGREEGV